MEHFVLNGSERTVVSQLRFSKHNMLHFLCGAVAAQNLAVAVEHERTYLRARTSGKAIARRPVFVSRSKHLDYGIFDSEKLITEMEKRPAL
jgi:hypothetical protein